MSDSDGEFDENFSDDGGEAFGDEMDVSEDDGCGLLLLCRFALTLSSPDRTKWTSL